MNERRKAVWLEIEKGIGRCCLHKKAALNEAMGLTSNVMSLATTAPEKDIEAFLGDIKFEKNQDRYSFIYHGVSVDLTTFSSVTDKEELYQKIFMHALTIDSIGFESNGKKANRYHGLQDVENKVLRLTSPGVSVSEGLMKRILTYVADGFTVEKGLREKIEQEQYFRRPSFRKKLAEVLTALMEDDSKSWSDVARVIDLVSNLEHRKAVVAFTKTNTDDKNDPKVRRTYEFLVFAFSGATSKEITPSLQGEKALCYYDSVCSNIRMRVKTLADFKNLKENYGEEFMELLFDVQELWMRVEKMPFKRPSEKDFDLMAQLIADPSYWADDEEDAEEESEPEEKNQIEGTLDVAKAISGEFNEEDYDDDMGGPVIDDYVPEEAMENGTHSSGVAEAGYELPPESKKGHYIDDEDIQDDKDSGGLDYEALDAIEREVAEQRKGASKPQQPVPARKPDGIRAARDHKSNLLNDGGE